MVMRYRKFGFSWCDLENIIVMEKYGMIGRGNLSLNSILGGFVFLGESRNSIAKKD